MINLMGRVHMAACDDPFRGVDGILPKERADLVMVDMHAEATSEAQAMGWHLDGRAAAVLGTHTHVPTLDAKVLPGGTAYVTDIGMTGPYEGVIGMKKEASLSRFLKVNGTSSRWPKMTCSSTRCWSSPKAGRPPASSGS